MHPFSPHLTSTETWKALRQATMCSQKREASCSDGISRSSILTSYEAGQVGWHARAIRLLPFICLIKKWTNWKLLSPDNEIWTTNKEPDLFSQTAGPNNFLDLRTMHPCLRQVTPNWGTQTVYKFISFRNSLSISNIHGHSHPKYVCLRTRPPPLIPSRSTVHNNSHSLPKTPKVCKKIGPYRNGNR